MEEKYNLNKKMEALQEIKKDYLYLKKHSKKEVIFLDMMLSSLLKPEEFEKIKKYNSEEENKK